MLRAKVKWSKKLIDQEKLTVRSELEKVMREGGPKRRLQHILAEIRHLKESDHHSGQLRCFVFIISGLVHQERYGGLTLKQVHQLVTMAYALLQIQSIEPVSSLLAFLYGEIHLALSQVYRKEGSHWMAAWEQQMATYLAGKEPGQIASVQKLSLGIRALRLGHGSLAMRAMVDAKSELAETSWFRCQIELIRSLRFSGETLLATDGIRESLERPHLKAEERQELSWEQMCLRIPTDGLLPLVQSVKKGNSHHDYVYLVETFLWTRAVSTKEWIERYPSLRSLVRDPKLKAPTKTLFYTSAVMLERCYDYEIPFPVRLRYLGRVLSRIQKLVTVDQELLVWAAVARWLTRSRCFPLATLALSEYQSLSLRLSGGKNPDSLGVLGDLLQRDWFMESQFDVRQLSLASKKDAA